jgi:hypothetical protein
MEEAKLMNKCGMQSARMLISDNRGGAAVLVLALLALSLCTVFTVTSFNVSVQYSSRNAIKPILDVATHAASLDIDMEQASFGRIVWDASRGTATFYNYLYRNLKLSSNGQPLSDSRVSGAPIVHVLSSITAASYPYDYSIAVTVRSGSPQQTIRHLQTRIYGPSVVAVVEFNQSQLGGMPPEPIVISSASSIRPRY